MHVIPKVRSFGEDFGRAIGGGAGQGVSEALKEKQEAKDLKKEAAEIEEKTGIKMPVIKNLEARKAYFTQALKQKQKSEEFKEKIAENKKQIAGIEKQYGLPEGSLQEFENDPALAARVAKPQKEPSKKGKTPEELKKEKQGRKKLLKETGEYKTEEELDEAAETLNDSSVRMKWQQSKKISPKSESQKLIEKETAKGYIEAKNELPKIESTLSNINRLREIGKTQLGGTSGYIKSAFNTSSAAEYNTLGATLLDPIIKIFNPVGAVPVTKLDWIKNTFRTNSSDTQSTQEGKLATLERLSNQAKERALAKIKLFNDFNGNPPESEVLKFDNESANQIIDFVDSHQYMDQLKKETKKGKVLMMSPEGKPMHVDPNQKMPNGMPAIEYLKSKGATLVEH